MARPRVHGTARGRTCKACGGDEWRAYNKGGKEVWHCVPCNRSSQNRLRGDPAWALWNSARARARKQGLSFTITLDDVRTVFPVDGCCAGSGERLVFHQGKAHANSPTLDRIDQTLGFEPGNIWVLAFAESASRRAFRRAVLV